MRSGTAISGPAIGPDDRWVWLPHARVMMRIDGIDEHGALRLFHEVSGRGCRVFDWQDQIIKMQYILMTDEEHDNYDRPENLITWDDC